MTVNRPSPIGPIQDALHRNADRHSARPVIIDASSMLTFGQLRERAEARAAELGSAPGSIVAVPARSNAAFFVEIAAIWLCGAVPMPIDPRTPLPWGTSLAQGAAADGHTCQPWKVTLSVAGGSYRPLITGGEPPTRPRKAHALGLGTPEVAAAGTVALFASPLYLNGPFDFAVRHLLLGGTVAMVERFDADRWIAAATAVRPRWVFLAPIQLARVMDAATADHLRNVLAPVDTLVHSSAPCPPSLRARLLDLVDPHTVADYYAAAEYEGTFARADEPLPAAAPLPGAQLRITDPTGAVAAPGTVGLIEGRSTCGVITHYAGEDCGHAMRWHGVGDRGFLDRRGRLRVTDVNAAGRAIVGGINVALSRVRAVLSAHASVLSCRVFPVSDSEYGHVIVAQVVTDRPVPADDLHAHCAAHLSPAERPRHLRATVQQSSLEERDHAASL